MRDECLERAGPARLRVDTYPVGDRVLLLVDQSPRQIAREPVTGVVPGRFAERELLSDPVEAVATVAYPIRPGNEILTPPGSAHLLNTEAAYYVATLD
jgi:hypothetical protein